MGKSASIRSDTVRIDRRAELIQATITVMYRDGLSNLTLAKVAAAAGFSTGIVNFYFKSKAQLLIDTLQVVSSEYEGAVDRALSGTEAAKKKLIRLINEILSQKICCPERAAVWYAFMGESQAREGYNSTVRERQETIRCRIEALFLELCERYDNPRIDAVAVARGLEAMIDSFWEQCVMEPDGFDHVAARQTCLRYLESLFPEEFSLPTVVPPQTEHQLLAPWTYLSSSLLKLEKEQLFYRRWMLAGHVSDFSKTGDYRTLDIGGERALVIRGIKGELLAFHNVCRHRGSRVVPNLSGNCGRVLVCPFHGWTYELDGQLKNVPRKENFLNLEKEQTGLIPIDLEVWHGFVFVRFRSSSSSVAEELAPIEDWMAPYRLAEMQPLGEPYSVEVKHNWKTFHDVDNEGYHVAAAHPGLYDLYGRGYKDFSINGVPITTGKVDDYSARNWSVARYKTLLPHFEHLPRDKQRLWVYVSLFPNLVIFLYPEKVGFYMSIPITVDRTIIVDREFGLPDSRKETQAARYLSRRIDSTTSKEDRNLVQWMNEALHSSVYPRGSLSRIEEGVVDFHDRLRRELPVMALEEAPTYGAIAEVNSRLTSVS